MLELNYETPEEKLELFPCFYSYVYSQRATFSPDESLFCSFLQVSESSKQRQKALQFALLQTVHEINCFADGVLFQEITFRKLSSPDRAKDTQ